MHIESYQNSLPGIKLQKQKLFKRVIIKAISAFENGASTEQSINYLFFLK